MKKFKKALTAAVMTIVISAASFSVYTPVHVSAGTMGGVIAKAREIGMPESEIQSYIAQYGGRDYTSEQYDQAIAALEGMRGQYSANNNADDTSSAETAADTTETTIPETTNEYTKKIDDFFNKSSEDKIRDIIGMTDDEAKEFSGYLTEDQKESLKEVLNADDVDDLKRSAEKAAAELGIAVETETVTETDTQTESSKESTSEIISSDTHSETTKAASETETTADAIKSTTNVMIWIVIGIIAAILIVFIIIALVLKKSNKK